MLELFRTYDQSNPSSPARSRASRGPLSEVVPHEGKSRSRVSGESFCFGSEEQADEVESGHGTLPTPPASSWLAPMPAEGAELYERIHREIGEELALESETRLISLFALKAELREEIGETEKRVLKKMHAFERRLLDWLEERLEDLDGRPKPFPSSDTEEAGGKPGHVEPTVIGVDWQQRMSMANGSDRGNEPTALGHANGGVAREPVLGTERQWRYSSASAGSQLSGNAASQEEVVEVRKQLETFKEDLDQKIRFAMASQRATPIIQTMDAERAEEVQNNMKKSVMQSIVQQQFPAMRSVQNQVDRMEGRIVEFEAWKEFTRVDQRIHDVEQFLHPQNFREQVLAVREKKMSNSDHFYGGHIQLEMMPNFFRHTNKSGTGFDPHQRLEEKIVSVGTIALLCIGLLFMFIFFVGEMFLAFGQLQDPDVESYNEIVKTYNLAFDPVCPCQRQAVPWKRLLEGVAYQLDSYCGVADEAALTGWVFGGDVTSLAQQRLQRASSTEQWSCIMGGLNPGLTAEQAARSGLSCGTVEAVFVALMLRLRDLCGVVARLHTANLEEFYDDVFISSELQNKEFFSRHAKVELLHLAGRNIAALAPAIQDSLVAHFDSLASLRDVFQAVVAPLPGSSSFNTTSCHTLSVGGRGNLSLSGIVAECAFGIGGTWTAQCCDEAGQCHTAANPCTAEMMTMANRAKRSEYDSVHNASRHAFLTGMVEGSSADSPFHPNMNGDSFFGNYFEQCAPVKCTYTYDRGRIRSGVFVALGVIGGMHAATRFAGFVVIAGYRRAEKLVKHDQDRHSMDVH